MRLVADACRVIALLFIVVLSACSGGGGNSQSSTTVTLNNIAFSAASPDAPTPTSQTFTATVSAGTVFVAILHNGAPISSASYTLSGTTAQIVVNPASPGSLGVGMFTGALTITGYNCADQKCSGLAAGNTQTVNVTYQIPPIVRFVAPYVGVAPMAGTAAGTVIIRGQGFEKYAVQNVMFSTTAATAFTVVSDTEIQASYSGLAAGTTYPVTIQAPSSPGTITSHANLVIINPPAYAPATLAYPSTAPVVKELVYDAERQALLIAVDSSGGEILRYPYTSGSWVAQAPAAINTLSDIALSTDGQQLLALAQTSLNQLDPVTLLATAPPTPAPTFATSGTVFKNLAVGNDGNAVVTTGYPPSTITSTALYLYCNPVYSICPSAFTQPVGTPTLDNSTAVASADGSLISLMQGDPALPPPPPYAYQYVAATDTFAAIGALLNQNSVAPAVDVITPPNTTTGTTRIVLSGTNTSNVLVTNVYDANYNLLGTLPSTTLAVVVKPDATRAYTFDSTASQILSFDLTATPAGGPFPQFPTGATPMTGTTPVGNPGTGVRLAISPDGGTLFLAGSSQIVVMPSPP